MYHYPCCLAVDGEHLSWEGSVNLIHRHGPFCEAEIQGHGSSFHIITGPQSNGHFLCIPNWNVGCELSTLDDVFWNSEQISRHLIPVDTETVARGLAAMNSLLNLLAA